MCSALVISSHIRAAAKMADIASMCCCRDELVAGRVSKCQELQIPVSRLAPCVAPLPVQWRCGTG